MLIHWQVTGPNCGKRTGTINENIGEKWDVMVRFLRFTEPDGFLVAFQGETKYNETKLNSDTEPERWFD